MRKNRTNRSSRKPLPSSTWSGTRRLTPLELIVGAKAALRDFFDEPFGPELRQLISK